MKPVFAGLELYKTGMEGNSMMIVISPELDYFSTFLYTLAVLTEDRNAATESKC